MHDAKVRQLTGPGVAGLEHCPPTYHFDFSHEEFMAFVANPAVSMKHLGLHFQVTSITLAQWHEWYSEKEGWTPNTELARRPPSGVCCHGGADGGVRCHMHK
jgi:hypothetical protein